MNGYESELIRYLKKFHQSSPDLYHAIYFNFYYSEVSTSELSSGLNLNKLADLLVFILSASNTDLPLATSKKNKACTTLKLLSN